MKTVGPDDYDAMYGLLDCGDAVVLEIGAADGFSSAFFLLKGARRVVAYEDEEGSLSPDSVVSLFDKHSPDVVKVDSEEAEKVLLGLPDAVVKRPRAWAMKVYSQGRLQFFRKRFRTLGYEVATIGEIRDGPRHGKAFIATRRDLWVPRRVEDYTDLLAQEKPFTYTNIGGDGEFLTIVGWPGTNSDDRTSTLEKSQLLAQVILEPRLTFHGYNPGKARTRKMSDAEQWLRRHGVNVPDLGHTDLIDEDYGKCRINCRWIHKEILSSANARGRLAGFLRALQQRPLLFIGCPEVKALAKRMGAETLLIPKTVGWGRMDWIEETIRNKLDTLPADTVSTWGLGYLAKVLQWRIAPDFPGVTQIDVGAMWDPYGGTDNRHAFKVPGWPDKMKQNLSLLT